jgi:hypothetical protein
MFSFDHLDNVWRTVQIKELSSFIQPLATSSVLVQSENMRAYRATGMSSRLCIHFTLFMQMHVKSYLAVWQ